jgi:hypothetical protein
MPVAVCQYGYMLDTNGNCVPMGADYNDCAPLGLTGTYPNCVCPTGQTFDASTNTCVAPTIVYGYGNWWENLWNAIASQIGWKAQQNQQTTPTNTQTTPTNTQTTQQPQGLSTIDWILITMIIIVAIIVIFIILDKKRR